MALGDDEEVETVVTLEDRHAAHSGEIAVLGGRRTIDDRELERSGVETENAAAHGRHGGVGAAHAELVAAGADEDGVVAALRQAAYRHGHILAVDTPRHPVPDFMVVGERGAHAAIGVEALKRRLVVRPDEETAGSGTGIDGCAVLTVGEKTGDMSADVDGANLNEIGVLLGTRSAPHQSQNACKQAEKYFVPFHKILLIS